MKKLLFWFFIVSVCSTSAQVVFFPKGAEWHYLYSGNRRSVGATFNEPILYSADSISGPDTIKILLHNRSSLYCGPLNFITWIKQKGDTIFFWNRTTQNSWQILYNFACQPGQGWQTILKDNGASAKTFTFVVQAVGSVTINGFALKTLTVSATPFSSTVITERFGASSFLFNFAFNYPNTCDNDLFIEFLCYQDSTFGLKQFSDKSCYYYTTSTVGLASSDFIDETVKVNPNPAREAFYVELENVSDYMFLTLTDLQGREVKKLPVQANTYVDLHDVKEGMYFISIKKGQTLVYKNKIIKN